MPALHALLTALVLTLPAWPAPPVDAAADEVELKTGKLLTGRILYEDGSVVILRSDSAEREIARDEIAAVRSRQRVLDDLLDSLESVDARDEAAMLALADRAREGGLPDEARLLDLWVICQHPDSAPANEALGNRQEAKGWRHHHGSSWLPVKELYKLQGEWKQRFTLRTMHYELQTDIPLTAALGCAFDLERLYRAYFHLFVGQVRVLGIRETMAVQVHADGNSYPEPGDGRPGYFSIDGLTLFVLARGTFGKILIHEATHQLLYFTAQRTAGARGEIPGWYDEGLAQYFAGGLENGPLGQRLIVGQPEGYKFREHASARDPYDLKRLLTMDSGDFTASNNSELKYSQAYTLVYYLLHGGKGGAPQPAFWTFSAHAFVGQSSMSDFKKALDVPLDDFEKSWKDYVREMAARD